MLPSSVRETLLSWHGSFVGKKRRKVWRAAPLHTFWTVWKVRNRLTFKDDELSIQRLEYSFILSLWPEAKLFIVECPQSMVNLLIGWDPFKVVFWASWSLGFFFFFSFGLFGGGCIGLYTLSCFSGISL